MVSKKGFDDLARDAINAGLCTSCGTCAGVCPSGVIHMDYEMDEPEPILRNHCNPCDTCYESCPGKDVPLMELDKFSFNRTRDVDSEPLGIFKESYRGCASNRDGIRADLGEPNHSSPQPAMKLRKACAALSWSVQSTSLLERLSWRGN